MPWDFTIDPTLVSWAEKFASGETAVMAVSAGLQAMYPAVMESIPVESAETYKAFAIVNFAHKEAGGAMGGIGELEKVGDPSAAAPKHTITEFMKWYRTQYKGT